MDIGPLRPADVDALVLFFDRLSPGDRTFFKQEVRGKSTVEDWLRDRDARRLLAHVDGRVVGCVAVVPGVGWSNHVRELLLVVEPAARGAGVGAALARAALDTALADGAAKVVVEVVADQVATIGLFTKLGFAAEALLVAHVRDATGQPHDLIVLTHPVDETWSTMSTLGIDDAVGS
jgi:L-amino acid N-acyltransferase YncA